MSGNKRINAKNILLLIEDYLSTITVNRGRDMNYDVFVNPSTSELAKLYKESGDYIRFLADNIDKKVYIFNSDLLHQEAYKRIYNIKTPLQFMLKGITGRHNEISIDTYIIPGYNHSDILSKDWSWTEHYLHRDVMKELKKFKEEEDDPYKSKLTEGIIFGNNIKGWYNYKTGDDIRFDFNLYHEDHFPYKVGGPWFRYTAINQPLVDQTYIETDIMNDQLFNTIKRFIRTFRHPVHVMWQGSEKSREYLDISRTISIDHSDKEFRN